MPQVCQCGELMTRLVTAGNFRMPGGNPKINYADQFTADALGIPAGEVPPGLRTPKGIA